MLIGGRTPARGLEPWTIYAGQTACDRLPVGELGQQLNPGEAASGKTEFRTTLLAHFAS